MIFNTHTHLNSEELYPIHEELIKNALENNVLKLVVVGFDLDSSKKAIEIANKYDFIYASVGICPTEIREDSVIEYEEYEKLLSNPKVVAVGEVGLDYYYETTAKEKQKECLLKFIEMANRHDLPIIIHSRDALLDTFNFLKENEVKNKGIMHCYSGSKEAALDFVKLGYYISLAGPVTFKNARVPKEVASSVPLEWLLVETDDPYLTPHPHRGKRNEPKNVTFVVDEIAKIKGVPYEEVAKTTFENAEKVFKLCKK